MKWEISDPQTNLSEPEYEHIRKTCCFMFSVVKDAPLTEQRNTNIVSHALQALK